MIAVALMPPVAAFVPSDGFLRGYPGVDIYRYIKDGTFPESKREFVALYCLDSVT